MDDDLDLYEDDIEGYCVRCRETVTFEDPQAVWTRRGLPATRGTCPQCSGAVFRMGKTDAHEQSTRPDAVQVGSGKRVKLAQETVYVNFAGEDEALAEQIAADLHKVGLPGWLHQEGGDVSWAGGVHPALTECSRMVVILSPSALSVESIEAAWRFFRSKGKPIVVAQVAPANLPDPLRRCARFDFTSDYKAAFRQMVQALSQ